MISQFAVQSRSFLDRRIIRSHEDYQHYSRKQHAFFHPLRDAVKLVEGHAVRIGRRDGIDGSARRDAIFSMRGMMENCEYAVSPSMMSVITTGAATLRGSAFMVCATRSRTTISVPENSPS